MFFRTPGPSASFGESTRAAQDPQTGSFGEAFFVAVEPINSTQILASRRFGSFGELATRDFARIACQTASFGDGDRRDSGADSRLQTLGRDVFVIEIATEQIAISRGKATSHSRCVLFTTRCEAKFDRTLVIE